MGDRKEEVAGSSSSGRKIPKVKESTELLFKNDAGFVYASDDDGGSETEPENASLTPSMSLAALRLAPSYPSSASDAGPPKSTASNTNPLGQIQGQTVLVPPWSLNSAASAPPSRPGVNNNGGQRRLTTPSLGKLKNKRPIP